jgi:hypothetical protein
MASYHRAHWSLRCRDPIAVNFLSQGEHPSPVENFSLAVSISCRPKTRDNFSCEFLHLRVFPSADDVGLIPFCRSIEKWDQPQISSVFLRALCGEFLSLSKSADSNSPSRRDSVPASAHRAVANPRLYKPFTGFTPLRTPHNPVLYSG